MPRLRRKYKSNIQLLRFRRHRKETGHALKLKNTCISVREEDNSLGIRRRVSQSRTTTLLPGRFI